MVDQICIWVATLPVHNLVRLSSTCRALRASITRGATVLRGALFWDREMQFHIDSGLFRPGQGRGNRTDAYRISVLAAPMLRAWSGMGRLKMEACVDDFDEEEGNTWTAAAHVEFSNLLARAGNLYYLDMRFVNVSHDMLARVTRPIAGCTGITLRTLLLGCSSFVGDEDAARIARMPSLTALDLSCSGPARRSRCSIFWDAIASRGRGGAPSTCYPGYEASTSGGGGSYWLRHSRTSRRPLR
jgi:hypothetical protein